MSLEYTYIIFKKDESLISIVPELPGVVAESDDIDDLKSRIKEAITVYIKTLKNEKLHIPPKLELVEVDTVEVEYE